MLIDLFGLLNLSALAPQNYRDQGGLRTIKLNWHYIILSIYRVVRVGLLLGYEVRVNY